jgi:hypothetical protein
MVNFVEWKFYCVFEVRKPLQYKENDNVIELTDHDQDEYKKTKYFKQRDFIALDLGPALEKNGLQHIKLMILDDARVLLPYWAEQVLYLFCPVGQ